MFQFLQTNSFPGLYLMDVMQNSSPDPRLLSWRKGAGKTPTPTLLQRCIKIRWTDGKSTLYRSLPSSDHCTWKKTRFFHELQIIIFSVHYFNKCTCGRFIAFLFCSHNISIDIRSVQNFAGLCQYNNRHKRFEYYNIPHLTFEVEFFYWNVVRTRARNSTFVAWDSGDFTYRLVLVTQVSIRPI